MSTKRALFIAYTFPPVGGAGVQRTTKFVKYLPQFGWAATVLTVSNPSVPLRDESLCRDVPSSTRLVRARTFEPSYATKVALTSCAGPGGGLNVMKRTFRRAMLGLMQPDPQVLWNPAAFFSGLLTLAKTRHDVIIASAPPFSSLLLGAALSRATNVPLVLDYRDEWDVSNTHWENRRLRGPSVAIQAAMERYALRCARAVVATSPRSAAALRALCRTARSSAPVTHILNGFDADDFNIAPAAGRRESSDTFRLVYTGTLYNLMSPEPLVEAIEALAAERPDLAGRMELVFAGRHAPEQRARLSRLRRVCQLRTVDYLSHPDAIALMDSADALLLLLSDAAGADRIIPAKLFEYMASRKLILAVAPRGDVWELLHSHPAAFAFEPRDVDGIRRWLARAIERGVRMPDGVPFDPTPFSRRCQAQRLASLLDGAVTADHGRRSITEEVTCSA
jgi:glycosyltransferase involved in cell wall biosynthesis